MRSDQQTDIFRDARQVHIDAWRAAAETARQQFPHDTKRHDFYDQQAERLEREMQG